MDRLGPDIFSQVDYLFVTQFRVKSYLRFCRVWMKLMETMKRFYQYRDHFEKNWSLFKMMDLLFKRSFSLFSNISIVG